jgi:hypothetical protein
VTQFVKCSDGTWLNLALITKIVPTDRSELRGSHQFLNQDGEIIGESEVMFDPTDLLPVVPSRAGEALFEFYARSTERRPASHDDIVMIEMPILGWHCGGYRATPVTYRSYFDRGASVYIYRRADGCFQDEWGDMPIFPDLKAAKEYVLKKIQDKWR